MFLGVIARSVRRRSNLLIHEEIASLLTVARNTRFAKQIAWRKCRCDMQDNYTFLFFLFFRLLSMRPLVPLLKHRRDTAFAPIPAPWAMMTPAPARTPEEEAES